MPGGRTTIFRRNRRRGRRGAKSIAIKALREVNKIKSNIETKFLVTPINFTSILAGTPQVLQLTDINTGDTVSSRDGNMISLKSVNIRGIMGVNDPTGTAENEVFRLLLFIDKEGEVVRTDLDELLETQTAINGLRDPVHMGDFRVIMDKLITTQNLSLSTNVSFRSFQVFKRFKRPIKVRYLDTVGTNPEANQLYFATMVHNNAAASSTTFVGRCIVKFTDS